MCQVEFEGNQDYGALQPASFLQLGCSAFGDFANEAGARLHDHARRSACC